MKAIVRCRSFSEDRIRSGGNVGVPFGDGPFELANLDAGIVSEVGKRFETLPWTPRVALRGAWTKS